MIFPMTAGTDLHMTEDYQGDGIHRRDFLQAVGGGILVSLLPGVTFSQQPVGGRGPGLGRNMPKELGAWLHINEAGQVTVNTGKVELGQNIRTSLSQAVAEELRLPLTAIRLQMADTDLTPFDVGTFGSLTTTLMAPVLRMVATAARELLIDLANEQLKVERASLVVADGKVTDPATRRSFSFPELLKGKKLTKWIGLDHLVPPPAPWKFAGKSVAKVDGRAFVTGKHEYATDIHLPGMLHGKVLRPDKLKADLASVNLKAAEAMPGVTVVRDGEFVGVAATTERLAEQAVRAIQAEWKSPPQPSDKELFELIRKRPASAQRRAGPSNPSPRIAQGLAAADHRFQATYTIAFIAHAPLEPRAAVAQWSEGKLTVWTNTQFPFGVRGELAKVFRMPQERIRVIVPDTGGAFGGKHTGEAAVEAARLAKVAGKPVKLVWTREEEFTWAYFRPAGVVEITSGVRKDGTITAWESHNFNCGGDGINPPYTIQHRRSVFHPSHAPLRQGAYRSRAATANNFARESHLDDLAQAVGFDPLEFRLKNLKEPRLRAVLEAAAKELGWGMNKPAPDHGFGIAAGTDKGSYVATAAEVAVDHSVSSVQVVRLITAFECGAIVNPDHLKNQVEGAALMGLGGALFEAIRFADGKILNASFSSYRVPRFSDAPLVHTLLLDRRDLPSAGAGETPLIAVAPAIGNAIFQARGKRLRSLPMLPNGLG